MRHSIKHALQDQASLRGPQLRATTKGLTRGALASSRRQAQADRVLAAARNTYLLRSRAQRASTLAQRRSKAIEPLLSAPPTSKAPRPKKRTHKRSSRANSPAATEASSRLPRVALGRQAPQERMQAAARDTHWTRSKAQRANILSSKRSPTRESVQRIGLHASECRAHASLSCFRSMCPYSSESTELASQHSCM